MKFLTTIAVAATALTIGVTGVAAQPDGYQPQLQQPTQPDGYQPQLGVGAPSQPFDRYAIDQSARSVAGGAASHPDSRAVRPGVVAEAEPIADVGSRFSWGSGAVGALGAWLVVVLAVVAASATRGRRRLVLR